MSWGKVSIRIIKEKLPIASEKQKHSSSQVNPKKRQNLEIDVHHLVEEFSEASDDNDDESEDEDEQISEILNRARRVPKTLSLMNRLLLQTSNLKL